MTVASQHFENSPPGSQPPLLMKFPRGDGKHTHRYLTVPCAVNSFIYNVRRTVSISSQHKYKPGSHQASQQAVYLCHPLGGATMNRHKCYYARTLLHYGDARGCLCMLSVCSPSGWIPAAAAAASSSARNIRAADLSLALFLRSVPHFRMKHWQANNFDAAHSCGVYCASSSTITSARITSTAPEWLNRWFKIIFVPVLPPLPHQHRQCAPL